MSRALRIALLLAALSGAVLAIVDYRRAQSEKVELATSLGVELETYAPELARRIESEIDPSVARLVLARSTVAAYLDPERRLAAALGATQESTLDALRQVHELARETLSDRPHSWQAAMLLGATTYLIRLRERDTRLFSQARDWEQPLETAHALAPEQIEPRRFLAAAYLDTWTALSPAKRDIARGLVREMLADRESFRLLIGAWLAVSTRPDSEDDPLSLVPAEPWAWSYLLEALSRSRDWERYVSARERWHASLAASLETTLAEARERIAGGDLETARSLLYSVISQTPLGAEYVDILSAALTQLPPGPVAAHAERRLRTWFDWSVRQSEVVVPPFAPAVMGRLAGAIRDALPHEAASAALAANDRVAAETIERRHRVEYEETWADYLLFKAHWLLERGELPAAEQARSAVHRSRFDTPRYRSLERRFAAIEGPAQRPVAAQLTALPRWSADEWSERGGLLELELELAAPAEGLAMIVPATAGGGAIDVLLDGRRLGTRIAGGRDGFEIRTRIEPGVHLLEIVPIVGARPRGASVRALSAQE